jgi:hypothetical protein
MEQAFIIMQIGNAELDQVCERAIVPALKACGLDPKRVDKHNRGDLLKSEIIAFIKSSEIIVADLTNERQNCYLEIGYAMGCGKNSGLILTAREDHNQDSPNYKQSGPKVHFDLSGYDILFWASDRLDQFRVELEKRIRRRQQNHAVSESSDLESPWDQEWFAYHEGKAEDGLLKCKGDPEAGFVEVEFTLSGEKPLKSQAQLLEAATKAQLKLGGWPFGIVMTNEFHPRPKKDEIVTEIGGQGRDIYDYWALRNNGDFYLRESLFEDARQTGKFSYATRITRIAESLLYCARLYKLLDVPDSRKVHIYVRHGGLKGRVLVSEGALGSDVRGHMTTEEEVDESVAIVLQSLRSKDQIVEVVKDLMNPLFIVFNYFELSDSAYSHIVNDYLRPLSA